MKKGFSVYLELVRVVATFLVLFSHAGHLGPQWLQEPFGELKLGRDGVVLFFVLSGFVITWCGKEKDKSVFEFATSRMARIYSVAIPGLLLGIIASLAVSHATAQPVDYTLNKIWLYYPIFLTFNSQSWLGFIFPAGNFAFWSLSYEVWYYVFISAVLFGGRYRLILAALAVLLMGPYIAVFLPLWGLGALLYYVKDRVCLPQSLHRTLFATSLIGFVLMKVYAIDTYLDQFNAEVLGIAANYLPAKQCLGDYALAIIAAINFFSAYHLNLSFSPKVTVVTRYFASFSFSTYMYHTPIFLLLSLFPFMHQETLMNYVFAVVVALLLCRLLAQATELQKGPAKRLVQTLARSVQAKLSRKPVPTNF